MLSTPGKSRVTTFTRYPGNLNSLSLLPGQQNHSMYHWIRRTGNSYMRALSTWRLKRYFSSRLPFRTRKLTISARTAMHSERFSPDDVRL